MRRESAVIAGVWVMFASTLTLAVVWMLAFVNGGAVTVTVAQYGEMWPEFVAWIPASAFTCYATGALTHETAAQ